MRVFSYSLFLLGLTLLLPMARSRAGDKLEPGFKLLFNGKDLDGWQTKGKKDSLTGKTDAFKGRFKVKDGTILVDYQTKGDSYIETTKEFAGDVHIKFDFKPGEACNNDFFLRGSKFDIILKLKGVKANEWNTMDIIVTGDMIEHKINGESARKGKTTPAKPKDETNEKAVAQYKAAVATSKSSPFMIRAEFGVIELKNIRVKQ